MQDSNEVFCKIEVTSDISPISVFKVYDKFICEDIVFCFVYSYSIRWNFKNITLGEMLCIIEAFVGDETF